MSNAEVERVARAIYAAAFMPRDDEEAQRRKPSPGWCWEKTSEEMREFVRRQALAAIAALKGCYTDD
jgi:hypothetical protein